MPTEPDPPGGGKGGAGGTPPAPASPEAEARKARAEWRLWLVNADVKSQDDYDKSVLALSGGALGVTFGFLKDLVGPDPRWKDFLLGAWLSWSMSISAVMWSFYASRRNIADRIRLLDGKTVASKKFWPELTDWLNRLSGTLFVVGVILMALFSWRNLDNLKKGEEKKAPAPTAAAGAIYVLQPAPIPTPVPSVVPGGKSVQPRTG